MYRETRIRPVARALRLLDRLTGHKNGISLTDPAAEIDVSVRQVRRDLLQLEQAGHDIRYTVHQRKRAARLVERSHSLVPISRRERYTLLAARNVFDAFEHTPFFNDIKSVFDKLSGKLTKAEQEELDRLSGCVIYIPDGGVKAYRGKEDVLDELQTGVMNRRIVRYKYRQARGRKQQGLIAPYAFAIHKNGLYVVAKRLRSTDEAQASLPIDELPGVFAAERFFHAEALRGTSFEVPKDLDLRRLFQSAFGVHLGHAENLQSVVIEFPKAKRSLVLARTWHPTQRVDHLPDGGVRLEFQCASLAPVVSWVLSWGPYAKVCAPRELVLSVRRELRQAHAVYE